MGVFTKLKGIFYDEVVVDEEPEIKEDYTLKNKRETPKEEKVIVNREEPKREEIKTIEEKVEPEVRKKVESRLDDTFSERDLFRSERTFNFTEFEDDEDLPPRKTVLPIDEVKQENVQQRNIQLQQEKPVTPPAPRVFKPSPVISPIYGILDKDYKRDEIQSRTTDSSSTKLTGAKATTYDSVRRKAYGTLEDDLEDTLNSMNNLTTTVVNERISEMEIKPEVIEPKTQKIEDLINKIEETTNELDRAMSIGEVEDTMEMNSYVDEPIDEVDEDKTMTDSTLEHDLFNLIDSMYDDKED